jgi:GNAT superfamily N-acetyltransferase
LRSLPDWFGIESAIRQYVAEVESLDVWVAFVGDRPVGILSLRHHFPLASEIHVMAVTSAFQGRGIGRALIAAAEGELRERKSEFLSVKTVAEGNPDPFYARTREFYLRAGFRPLEVFPTLWDAWNPCLLMVKRV